MDSLHPRVRGVWAARALLAAVAVGVAALGARRFLFDVPLWAVAALTGAAAVLGLLHVAARYRRWRYEVQSDALYLERGVLTEVETAVPFVRVQHVDTRRGPLDRLFGVATVVVYTAGTRGADVSVPGLTPDRATALRNRLRELAVESEPEEAV